MVLCENDHLAVGFDVALWKLWVEAVKSSTTNYRIIINYH